MQNPEFLPEERAILDALRRRLDTASTALEAVFLRRQYTQTVATLQTADNKAPTP